MSDAFFEKLFGDSEPGHLGSGWMSGTSSVFFGLLGFGGALCLHFPALLTLPDARAHYPMTIIRLLIQGAIVLAIVLGAISASCASARCWPSPACRWDCWRRSSAAEARRCRTKSTRNSASVWIGFCWICS